MASITTSTTPTSSSSTKRQRQHLVLVGGGHSHVQVVKGLHHLSEGRQYIDLDVTLIDLTDSPAYSGMVPGTVAGIYSPHESCIALRPLCEWSQITFIQDRVVDIDVDTKTVVLANGGSRWGKQEQRIPFDVISIDIGSTCRGLDWIRGAKKYCIPTRPISELVKQIESTTNILTKALALNTAPSLVAHVNVVVVGGGAAGIELSMNILGRWKPIVDGHGTINVTVLNSGSMLFPDETSANRNALLHQLEERGIIVVNNASVKYVNKKSLIVQVTQQQSESESESSGDERERERERDSSSIVYEFTYCLWATGADCHRQLSSSFMDNGPAVSDHGWIEVNECFQSISHPFVFASGDCCSMENTSPQPPKAGVYAVRAGPILLENLTRYLLNNDCTSSHLQAYIPQTDFLKLIGCGDRTAQGFHLWIPFYGKWVFQLKNAIDRLFIDGFKRENLPELIEGQLYDASQQFDNAPEDNLPPAMPPIDAVLLLQRTDADVDYKQAWTILREMTKNDTYRAEVVSCYHQRQYS